MSLGIEDPLVEIEVLVVLEQQVKVLERLGQEEALHLVAWTRVLHVGHVVDGRVAARVDTRVLFERGEYAPAVLAVLGLLGDLPQVVERLDRLGPEQVVLVCVADKNVAGGAGKRVELNDLGAQTGRLKKDSKKEIKV